MIPEFKAAALARPIHILLSYDEETTCLGPLDVIARLRRRSAAARRRRSSASRPPCRSPTRIRASRRYRHHGARPRDPLGQSASRRQRRACRLRLIARAGAHRRGVGAIGDPSGRFDPPYSTLHVGVIQGGTARNIVAKDCEFQWEFRGLPSADADASRATGWRPSRKRLRETIFAPLPRMPGSRRRSRSRCPASRRSRARGRDAGAAPRPRNHTDRRALTPPRPASSSRRACRPSICGPGRIDQAHQPDEYIEISELSACIEFLRGLARSLEA